VLVSGLSLAWLPRRFRSGRLQRRSRRKHIDVPGEYIGGENVRDVLLPLEDHDAGVRERGHRLDVGLAGSGLSDPVTIRVGTVIFAAASGSKGASETARISRGSCVRLSSSRPQARTRLFA
jgi:hypothetical protein